ncbi:MAG: hypothetical protein WAT74_13460, partial [Flavobacteriales bacterium]
ASVGVDDIREQIAKIIWNNSASGREGAHDLACLITDRVVVPLIERDTAVRLLREALDAAPKHVPVMKLATQLAVVEAFVESLDGPDEPAPITDREVAEYMDGLPGGPVEGNTEYRDLLFEVRDESAKGEL